MHVRCALSALLVAGCGAVHLGDERAPDGGADADEAAPIQVSVALRSDGCEGCFALTARASGGSGPYVFEWENGSHDAERRVCPPLAGAVRVKVRDASGAQSVEHVEELQFPDASCPPPPPLLCVKNPSFEGTPAANIGFTPVFDCPGWSDCADPGTTNTPDVVSDTIQQSIAMVPKPTDGATILGLMEGEQASQELCMPLAGGSTVSLQLDLMRLYIGAGVVPDTELPFLEIWGGIASDCSARELLWASRPLGSSFETQCATLRPRQFMNQIMLRARSDNSQLALSYLLVDNLRPVSTCP